MCLTCSDSFYFIFSPNCPRSPLFGFFITRIDDNCTFESTFFIIIQKPTTVCCHYVLLSVRLYLRQICRKNVSRPIKRLWQEFLTTFFYNFTFIYSNKYLFSSNICTNQIKFGSQLLHLRVITIRSLYHYNPPYIGTTIIPTIVILLIYYDDKS